jgi:hypothetical protein
MGSGLSLQHAIWASRFCPSKGLGSKRSVIHLMRRVSHVAPLCQKGGEGRVVLLNNLVEKGLPWPVALVTASQPISLGISCRGGRRHDSHPCDTVYSYSLALGCRDLKNRL